MPLIEVFIGAFDDIAVLAQLGVVADRPAAGGPATKPVVLLVGAFGDDRPGAPLAQQRPVGAAGVGLVSQQRIGSGPSPAPTTTRDSSEPQKLRQHGAVAALPGSGFDHQRWAPW